MAESKKSAREALKSLPSIDDLLKEYSHFETTHLHARLAARETVAYVRHQILAGQVVDDVLNYTRKIMEARMMALSTPNMTPVINGTGVVLHTGLGRAPLSRGVIDRAFCIVTGYTDLEFDLKSGQRGERQEIVSEHFQALTGAEASLVVNNNAAAVLLMLNAIADGKEVIISRGQQVEIGGSFRIPDVIQKANARQVEVGTTNRTHLKDYAAAITENTGALLYVHPSNYRVEGFISEVSVSELAGLAKERGLPLLVDLGSGSLTDAPIDGMAYEPSVATIVKAGADLVSFSGDKLLGGPQAGIIVGAGKWIKILHQNSLYRALRCDKITLALLDQILRTYVDTDRSNEDNLAQALLKRSRVEIRKQADDLLERLGSAVDLSRIEVVESEVETGSGSLPGVVLPSLALKINQPGAKANALAAAFRTGESAVVGYVNKNQFYIDLKAIPMEKNYQLAQAIERVFSSNK